MAVASATNINEVLDGHVVLEVESLDRLYLNAYVRAMAVGGQVVRFLTDHLGNTIPHPASFTKIGNRFRQQVHAFAHTQGIPMLRLKKPDRSRWDDRKLDHVRPYLDEAESEGRFGVVAIVVSPTGPQAWPMLLANPWPNQGGKQHLHSRSPRIRRCLK